MNVLAGWIRPKVAIRIPILISLRFINLPLPLQELPHCQAGEQALHHIATALEFVAW